ncbi:MAG: putative Ig domain-containing protein, partial [Prosthecobacter sp.]|nr:putative Ig domain-containing protein [Prosthecobacter sp.]
VVQRAVAEYQYFLEKELTLSCVASTAPGNTLTYQWLRNGVPLTDPAGFYGVQKATLRIPQASSEFRGDYECVVTMTDSDGQVSLSHGLTEVFYLASEKPSFINPQVFWHFMGQAIQIQLLADQPDCSFTATGLPQGLKMNRSGLITGTLTKCSEYSVTIRVRNAVGAGLPAKFIWGVSRFISSGNYEGLIERNGSLDGGLAQGSLVKITATSRGSLSGKLMHAGKTWRFAKSLPFDPLGTSYERNIFFTIPQGKGAEPLTLVLGVGPESIRYNSYNMTLVDVDGQESEGELHEIRYWPTYPWYTPKMPLVWSLVPGESLAEESPQGVGFLTATATLYNPTIVWKGRLADGTAITGSSGCWITSGGISGKISVHCPLYRGRGMLHGTLTFNSSQSDVMTWNKDAPPGATRERVYPSGFPLQTLTAMNGKVNFPINDLLMQIPEGEQNARVSIVGSSVPGLEMSQTFTLTAKPKVKLPALDSEHFIKSLSFDSETWTFKGVLVIPNEEEHKLTRNVPFQGSILHYEGVSLGYFLLPELPALDQPASSLKKTPVQSCLIQIEAAENGDL